MTEGTQDWYERLSRAEREVLEAYAERHSYQAVAQALGKSVSVVDQQLLSARRKMDAVSTAQAVAMLVERRAHVALEERKSGDAGSASSKLKVGNGKPNGNGHARKAAQPAHRGNRWLIAVAGVLALGCLAAFGGMALNKGKASSEAAPNAARTAASIAAQIKAIEAEGGGDSDDKAKRRAELVGQLCDKLWDDKWGPDEDVDVKRVLPGVAADITNSFEWSCQHDQDLAVRIIGNGHRLFKTMGEPMEKWHAMVARALNLKGTKRGVEYGRLECAYALSRLIQEPGNNKALLEGLQKASDARTIFQKLNKESEEANAMRHMGMCLAIADRTNAMALYQDALAIYRRMQDQRGIAQTLLSIAQVGSRDESGAVYAKRGRDILSAIEACRKTENTEMLGEAWDEMRLYIHIPSEYKDVLSGIRQEKRLRAKAAVQTHDKLPRMITLVDCIEIDLRLNDDTALAEDLEDALGDTQGLPMHAENLEQVRGFYETLCQRLRRTPASRIVSNADVLHPKDHEAGRHLPKSQLLKTARAMYG